MTQFLKHLDSIRKGALVRDQGCKFEIAVAQPSVGLAHRVRPKMEWAVDFDLVVMEVVGLKAHLGAGRWTSEEDDASAAVGKLNCVFPNLDRTGAFDNDVKGALQTGVVKNGCRRPHELACPKAVMVATGKDHFVGAKMPGRSNKHEADRARTYDKDAIITSDMDALERLRNASQWLQKARFRKRKAGGFLEEMNVCDAPRNQHVFSIGPKYLVRHDAFTKIFLPSLAPAAVLARGAVNAHDFISNLDLRPLADGGDDSRVLVPKGSRHGDLGVPAEVSLQVRATRRRGFDPDKNITGTGNRNCYFIQVQIAWRLEHERRH
jgi:hypothetical protein